jgi:aminotransferase
MKSNGMMSSPLYRISETVVALPPSGIRAFFDLVMSMENVISLGVGEPDFVTPRPTREAGIAALEKGYTSYTSNRGMPALLRAIADFVAAQYGVQYDPQTEIVVTVGVSEGMDIAMRAILNPGDEVIVPEPCYVSYAATVKLAGGTPVMLDTWTQPGFKVTPAALAALITPRTRAFILNYPANPTGTSYTREELEALAAVVRAHDNILMISDEIYDALSYEEPHVAMPSLGGMRERTLYLNGFSKGFAMTGFRLGYACGPEPIIAAMLKIHQYTIMCAPIVSQMAGVEALQHGMPAVFEMVAEYNRRRRFIVAALNDMGLACHMPQGAFYAFPSLAATGLDGTAFATRLLQEQRVAVVPGTAFGQAGNGHIRLTYAASMDNIERAMERIRAFLKTLGV